MTCRKRILTLSLSILIMAVASLHGQQGSEGSPAVSAPPPAGGARTPVKNAENWSALPLKSSGLDTSRMNVTRVSLWEKEDYTEELLRAQWRPNDPIDLYIVRPKGKEKVPAILYLYDYSNDTERFRTESWCKRMTQGGFAAVGFISAVSGDRIHSPRPLKTTFVGELQEALGTSVHDVQMILNYLETRGDIDVGHSGMFGQGSGASIAVMAAAVDPRITTLDLYNLWGDWPDWLRESPVVPQEERAKYVTPEFLKKVEKLDPALYLPQLESQHVRIEYVMDDETMPKSMLQVMLNATPKNAEVLRYDDEGQHMDEWHKWGLSGWIKAQLKPGWTPIPTDAAPAVPSGN